MRDTIGSLKGQFIEFGYGHYFVETESGNFHWTSEDNLITPYKGSICNFAMQRGCSGKETGVFSIAEKCGDFKFSKKRK